MVISEEKMQELQNDESFIEAWTAATDKEQICQLLKSHGISASQEEISSFLEQFTTSGEELTDDALEEVSGGFSLFRIIWNQRGGCGTTCPLCGRINGIFGHICKNPTGLGSFPWGKKKNRW